MYAVPVKKKRNYRKEYDSYHKKPAQKKRRAQRNTSRAAAVKAGRVKKGDGKDVDHPNRNTASKKTRILSKKANRSHGGKVGSKAGKKMGGRKGGKATARKRATKKK